MIFSKFLCFLPLLSCIVSKRNSDNLFFFEGVWNLHKLCTNILIWWWIIFKSIELCNKWIPFIFLKIWAGILLKIFHFDYYTDKIWQCCIIAVGSKTVKLQNAKCRAESYLEAMIKSKKFTIIITSFSIRRVINSREACKSDDEFIKTHFTILNTTKHQLLLFVKRGNDLSPRLCFFTDDAALL